MTAGNEALDHFLTLMLPLPAPSVCMLTQVDVDGGVHACCCCDGGATATVNVFLHSLLALSLMHTHLRSLTQICATRRPLARLHDAKRERELDARERSLFHVFSSFPPPMLSHILSMPFFRLDCFSRAPVDEVSCC